MTVTKKITFACIASCLFALSGMAQTSLNVYPLNNSFGLKFSGDKRISPEIRLDFQVDMAGGESNVYVNPEVFVLLNLLREEQFQLYTGLGLGGNLYNQATSNLCGTLPLGATYYFAANKRFALVGECGIKLTASDNIKLRSYALVGLQIRLK
jgi:hypothetical protein